MERIRMRYDEQEVNDADLIMLVKADDGHLCGYVSTIASLISAWQMCDPASVLMLEWEEKVKLYEKVNGTYKYREGYSGPIKYLNT